MSPSDGGSEMSYSVETSSVDLERIKLRAQESAHDAVDGVVGGQKHTLVDVSIQFIGAEGLPKVDVIGSVNPYFVATIDDRIKFKSTVQSNTLNPIWNELWHVKNVPSDGKLKVTVYDKNDGSLPDGYIGVCELSLEDGAKEEVIRGSFKREKGAFWVKVTTHPTSSPSLLPYTFDGPIAYSQHSSPTIGRLTHLDENGKRLYSTWKIRIIGIASFFGTAAGVTPQHWNTGYPAAQHIFGIRPSSLAVRSTIHAGHRMLYARSTRNAFGILSTASDFINLLRGGGRAAPHRVKPAIYTYVIAMDDDTLRFSETGAAFFVDFVSKHALHANCAEAVWYAGEFHPRPTCEGGWAACDEHARGDEEVGWEVVWDNNSGTYAPDPAFLPRLKELVEYNFPGMGVVVMDQADPELAKSREACRQYAVRWREEGQKELQPHTNQESEETLNERAGVGLEPHISSEGGEVVDG